MTPRILDAPATTALVIATVATYLIQLLVGNDVVEQFFGLIPARISRPSAIGGAILGWSTLVTYMFLHRGWWHVATNMAGLWFLGRLAEPVFGSIRYLLIYLASGVLTGIVIVLLVPVWTSPMVGASGAICGVLGAFMALRLTHGALEGHRKIALLTIEGMAIIGVVVWLVVRTSSASPDRMSALMWHALPFLAAWTVVHFRRHLHGSSGTRLEWACRPRD
jgi:membrane associated rhomboid family serine protease